MLIEWRRRGWTWENRLFVDMMVFPDQTENGNQRAREVAQCVVTNTVVIIFWVSSESVHGFCFWLCLVAVCRLSARVYECRWWWSQKTLVVCFPDNGRSRVDPVVSSNDEPLDVDGWFRTLYAIWRGDLILWPTGENVDTFYLFSFLPWNVLGPHWW